MALNTILTSNLKFSDLNFTQDCDAAADFNRLYFWGSRENFIRTYQSLLRFVNSALPLGTDVPSNGTIMKWFVDLNDDDHSREVMLQHMYKTPFDACLEQSCKAITYPGNADIAGIGMLWAYSIEAAMATVYFLALISIMIYQRTPEPTRHVHNRPIGDWQILTWERKEWRAVANRFLDAIYFTIDDFLDAALLFSFAVIVAGIVMISDSKKTYDMLQSLLVTGFTLSAVITIWPLRKGSKRRKVPRHLLLVLLIALAFYQIRMVAGTERSTRYITRREVDCLKEIFVDFKKPSLHFRLLEVFTGIGLGFALFILPFTFLKIPDKIMEKWKVVGWIKSYWRQTLSFYGFACMWISFGTLWWVRGLVEKRIGTSYGEKSWGFGQVLALTTWLPVQELCVDILLRGPKKGLQERMPPPWKILEDGSEYDVLSGQSVQDTGDGHEVLPLQQMNSSAA